MAAVRSERPQYETLPRLTAWQVFLRSLTLQASWNDQRMQNLGLLATLAPWLRRQGLDRDRLRRVCRRYYGYFNTNPYLAGYVIGGLLRIEHDRELGRPVPDRLVSGFRDTLARACGSLGDQLFWLGLRPALMLLACLLALGGHWIGALAVIGVFAAAQMGLRRRGLRQGFGMGPDVIDVLGRPGWHVAIRWTQRTALVLTGVLVGIYFARVLDVGHARELASRVALVVTGFTLPALVRQKVSGEMQVLLAIVPATILALVF